MARWWAEFGLLARPAIARFREIDVYGDNTEDQASPENGIIIYVARK